MTIMNKLKKAIVIYKTQGPKAFVYRTGNFFAYKTQLF